jgi:hypothetical protein
MKKEYETMILLKRQAKYVYDWIYECIDRSLEHWINETKLKLMLHYSPDQNCMNCTKDIGKLVFENKNLEKEIATLMRLDGWSVFRAEQQITYTNPPNGTPNGQPYQNIEYFIIMEE